MTVTSLWYFCSPLQFSNPPPAGRNATLGWLGSGHGPVGPSMAPEHGRTSLLGGWNPRCTVPAFSSDGITLSPMMAQLEVIHPHSCSPTKRKCKGRECCKAGRNSGPCSLHRPYGHREDSCWGRNWTLARPLISTARAGACEVKSEAALPITRIDTNNGRNALGGGRSSNG
ncbi:hypothetical protein L209DRAFT_42075 [Thermothelomyces heterothallicus CBS 203.75]